MINQNMTVTLGDYTFDQLIGLIQGSANACDMYKIFINELIQRDKYLCTKARNMEKIIQIW